MYSKNIKNINRLLATFIFLIAFTGTTLAASKTEIDIEQMGIDQIAQLLDEHQATLGCITQYKLGPFALAQEFPLAKRFNCKSIVSSVKGGKGLSGKELKNAVSKFAAKMKPEFDQAAEAGIRILLENHGGCMVESIDGINWLLDECEHPGFGFALAPAHLPQDSAKIAQLIKNADKRLAMFYGWQFGEGFMTKMPREKEMLQMPGLGPLDFRPIIKAMAEINYTGWTEIMMHPTPRGIPIASSTHEVTQAISTAQRYLRNCV